VNLRFVFEGMEECELLLTCLEVEYQELISSAAGSHGLDAMLRQENCAPDSWLKDIDAICIVR
jgi:hypothetical protein